MHKGLTFPWMWWIGSVKHRNQPATNLLEAMAERNLLVKYSNPYIIFIQGASASNLSPNQIAIYKLPSTATATVSNYSYVVTLHISYLVYNCNVQNFICIMLDGLYSSRRQHEEFSDGAQDLS
jgi:hypothetical protein